MLGALRSLNFADSGCEDVLNAARASMYDYLHTRLFPSPEQIESHKALLESLHLLPASQEPNVAGQIESGS
jgi:hypothetical protein